MKFPADKAGLLESLHPCAKAWSSVVTTEDCLVLSGGSHLTRNGDKLRCLVFCSWGESQTLYNYEAGMCVYVCHMML